MGCLNSKGQFEHWFANIHLSGPCNRACYFCIGQHMMALDRLNNLDQWPLDGWDEFIDRCKEHKVGDVNLTGSNTDPLLYEHHVTLTEALRKELPDVKIGLRTNGVFREKFKNVWPLYDKGSISVSSLDHDIYKATMGRGKPPEIYYLKNLAGNKPLKVNIVLCPETLDGDLVTTLNLLYQYGFETVNLREPYGQPRIGHEKVEECFAKEGLNISRSGDLLGMPVYDWLGMKVTYWDVHFVEVESVNLYANGRVSVTYPVTKGHTPNGVVQGQEQFTTSGRVREQWVKEPST